MARGILGLSQTRPPPPPSPVSLTSDTTRHAFASFPWRTDLLKSALTASDQLHARAIAKAKRYRARTRDTFEGAAKLNARKLVKSDLSPRDLIKIYRTRPRARLIVSGPRRRPMTRLLPRDKAAEVKRPTSGRVQIYASYAARSSRSRDGDLSSALLPLSFRASYPPPFPSSPPRYHLRSFSPRSHLALLSFFLPRFSLVSISVTDCQRREDGQKLTVSKVKTTRRSETRGEARDPATKFNKIEGRITINGERQITAR